jgi:perosamine synthetase
MIPSIEKLLVLNTSSLIMALQVIDQTSQGFAIIVDEDGLMCGLLSDGDIRRKLINGMSINAPVSQAISNNFIAFPMDVQLETLQNAFNEKIRFIPLLDPEGRPVDYASRTRLKTISFNSPVMRGNELAYVTDCFHTNTIGNYGEYIRRFERAFGADYHTKFVVATSCASAGMFIALASHGLGNKEEIILSNFADPSIAASILYAGAVPKLVDINPKTWTMNPDAVEASITTRTSAIIASHIYGLPCDMTKLVSIAKKHGILLIEDCSQAIGSKLNGIKLGSIGDVAVFSFQDKKTLTTGEGGLILFKNQNAYNRSITLLDHGRIEHSKNFHQVIGPNYRMTNLQAAIGLAQLEQLNGFLEKKSSISRKYMELFQVLQGIILPNNPYGDNLYFDSFPILLTSETRVGRDEMLERLHLAGIESQPFLSPLHQIDCYNLFGNEKYLRNSIEISKNGLTLPSPSTLITEQIDFIYQAFESIFFVRSKLTD